VIQPGFTVQKIWLKHLGACELWKEIPLPLLPPDWSMMEILKKQNSATMLCSPNLATATLYTDFLDYDRPTNEARYFNGGKLVDSINVLTSKKGYYNANSNLASFKKDVKVTNPDYTMTADSLQYNSKSKVHSICF
jgi:lipopolysaccharide assembly outer membrane protein LptD (OstA)